MKKVITAVLFIWLCNFQNALAQTTISGRLGFGIAQSRDMANYPIHEETLLRNQGNLGLSSKTKFTKFFVPGSIQLSFSTYSRVLNPKPTGDGDRYNGGYVNNYSFLNIQSGIGTVLAKKINIEFLIGYGLLLNEQSEQFRYSELPYGEWLQSHNLGLTSRIGYQFGPKLGIYTELNHISELKETIGYKRSQTSYSLGIDVRLFTIEKNP